MECPNCKRKVNWADVVRGAFDRRYLCSECSLEIHLKNIRGSIFDWIVEITYIPITFVLFFVFGGDLLVLIVGFLCLFISWIMVSKRSLYGKLSKYRIGKNN